jgi:hypothetical protein
MKLRHSITVFVIFGMLITTGFVGTISTVEGAIITLSGYDAELFTTVTSGGDLRNGLIQIDEAPDGTLFVGQDFYDAPSQIYKIKPDRSWTLFGSPAVLDPDAVTVNSAGTIFTGGDGYIYELTPSGSSSLLTGREFYPAGPHHLEVSPSDQLYAMGDHSSIPIIYEVSSTGTVSLFGMGESITFDEAGNIYILRYEEILVQYPNGTGGTLLTGVLGAELEYHPSGFFLTVGDGVVYLTPLDGSGQVILASGFKFAFDVTVAASGDIFVTDHFDVYRIYKVDVNEPPVADAGDDQIVNEFDKVLFNGNGSYDPDNNTPKEGNGWYTEVVDTNGGVYYHSSLALGADDLPHISYFDGPNKDLKYAKWTGVSWENTTVDSAGYVGHYNSMALDANGFPHISYTNYPNGLGYARWDGTSWNKEIVDNICSGYISLALDSFDNPHISYSPSGYGNYTIKYAKWTGSSWIIETVVDFEYGGYTSISLDSMDYPAITYVGWTSSSLDKNLKFARWNGSTWNYETIDSVGDVGYYNFLALDSNDYPHVSYCDNTNDNVKFAKWTGTAWNIGIVDSIENYDGSTSLALDSDDNAHICYYDRGDNEIKYATGSFFNWSIETIESIGPMEPYGSFMLSIELDQNQEPNISYYSTTTRALKYARRPDGGISNLNYSWDFNNYIDSDSDGVFNNDIDATGPNPSHVYGDDGNFTVTLTVTDKNGLSDSDNCIITVLNVDPTVEIESPTMDVEIGLRVAGRKFNDVGMTLSENENIVGYVSIERMPGSPDDQMAWIPITLNLSRTYSASVFYTPEDPPNIGGNPVWIYIKFPNGSIQKIHHTFNVQQSKKRDSDHWNHVEPWEVDINSNLTGWEFEVAYHVTDPGSDDEVLTFTYGSQTKIVTYLNNPPDPDPFPSPEVNPKNIMAMVNLIYEGTGELTLNVRDDDNIRLTTSGESIEILLK